MRQLHELHGKLHKSDTCPLSLSLSPRTVLPPSENQNHVVEESLSPEYLSEDVHHGLGETRLVGGFER